MNKEDINALDEIHKGACMGKDAIHYVREKVEDKKLKDVLDAQYEQYQTIANKVENIYPKYNNDKPHETSTMNKAMTWYGIQMKTLMDKSNSKISELLLQGVNMGIIEGKKILNKKNLSKEVYDIISEYVSMQEKSIEILKEYL